MLAVYLFETYWKNLGNRCCLTHGAYLETTSDARHRLPGKGEFFKELSIWVS